MLVTVGNIVIDPEMILIVYRHTKESGIEGYDFKIMLRNNQTFELEESEYNDFLQLYKVNNNGA